jgi:hypothetical protein
VFINKLLRRRRSNLLGYFCQRIYGAKDKAFEHYPTKITLSDIKTALLADDYHCKKTSFGQSCSKLFPMKKLMTVAVLTAFLSGLAAQCPVGDINLFKQADVNHFVTTFPNCEDLDGNLTLGKMNSDSDITDLTGLSKLTAISGSLTIIGNPDLSSLNGLQNLQHIGGDLSVIQNPELPSLQGLNGLINIGGDFTLSFQDKVSSLQGLNNLESIGGNLSLTYTPALISLEGLEALTQIDGSLIAEYNEQLLSMKGLDNLETIGVDLILRNNEAFIRMDGLEKLHTIGRDLRIGWEYLDGFAGNPNLTDLGALENLNTIGGKLGIMGNENLSQCAIDAICDFLAVGGPSIIQNNATGCDTKE